MKILNQYLGKSLLRGYLPVLFIFLAVFSLIVFVEELDEVGKGRYTFLGAGEFVVLTLPSRAVYLAPFVALLGSIIALGALAKGQELIAMQAVGISPYQIAMSVMKVGVVFIFVVACFQEFVTPPLDRQAHFQRSLALSKSKAYQGKQGLWFREGRRFVRVQKVVFGEVPQGIDIFEFKEDGEMLSYLHAQEADVEDPRRWTLKNIQKKIINGQHVSEENMSTLEWDSPLKKGEMRLLTLPTSSLAPSDLFQYIKVLQRKGQSSLRYELVFWDKLFMPLNSALMILVAMPFVFGPLRTATVGKRILIGSLAGLAFYIMSEVLEQVGLLFGAPPLLTTFFPFLGLLTATILLWKQYFV